jgi:hypothetical protein
LREGFHIIKNGSVRENGKPLLETSRRKKMPKKYADFHAD